jgi:hypothetical protein
MYIVAQLDRQLELEDLPALRFKQLFSNLETDLLTFPPSDKVPIPFRCFCGTSKGWREYKHKSLQRPRRGKRPFNQRWSCMQMYYAPVL